MGGFDYGCLYKPVLNHRASFPSEVFEPTHSEVLWMFLRQQRTLLTAVLCVGD